MIRASVMNIILDFSLNPDTPKGFFLPNNNKYLFQVRWTKFATKLYVKKEENTNPRNRSSKMEDIRVRYVKKHSPEILIVNIILKLSILEFGILVTNVSILPRTLII